jgi:hypothetical protein
MPVALASLLLLTAARPAVNAARYPVVIVPGDASNQLLARLDKAGAPRWWCARKRDWFRQWLTLTDLLNPFELPCWCDNMKLVRNETTGLAQNTPGVYTRVPDFGGTSSLEDLDPSIPGHLASVWGRMVGALVDAGYARNASLRGAPYDFRYSPRSDPAYFGQLEALVVDTSAAHGGAPVVLVSHSLGCLQVHTFLRSRTREWKVKYVRRWISVAGPYGGTNSLLLLHARGDNQGLPVSSLALREQQRSYETNSWMLPQPSVWGGAPLARTAARTFSAADLPEFLRDAGSHIGAQFLRALGPLREHFASPPGVAVDCFLSEGIPTPEHFEWATPDLSQQPRTVMGDGDGAVNARSLRVCASWAKAQAEPVRVQSFSGVSHSQMVSDPRVIEHVLASASAADPAAVS